MLLTVRYHIQIRRTSDPECRMPAHRFIFTDLIFSGYIPATFYSAAKNEYLKPPVGIQPSPFVLNELRELLGEENVVCR